MKPNELYFKGAWMNFHEGPAKITGFINGGVYFKDGFGYGFSSRPGPIPLSFEFMTKNFPKPDIVVWNPGAVDNNHCFYCEVGGEDSKRSISGDFYYVHELQAALKLCGIEKNIEL